MSDFDDATRARWAGKAEAYERSFAPLCAYTSGHLLDAVGPVEGKRLLDVGTGTGTVAARALKRGALVLAVDPDPDMLEIGRTKAVGAVFGGFGLPDLPFTRGVFDCVVANFVINHVGDPRAAVVELARVVRPGGRLAVTIWPHPKPIVHALFDQLIAGSGIEPPIPKRLPTHLDFARDEEGLAGILLDAGLVEVAATRISWTHKTSLEDWWAGPAGGVAGIGEFVSGQTTAAVAKLRAEFERLVEPFRDGDYLALPAEALLASGRLRVGS